MTANQSNQESQQTLLVTLRKKALQFWLAGTSLIGSLVILLSILMMVIIAQASSVESSVLSERVIEEGGESVVAVVDIAGVIVQDAGESGPFSVSEGVASVEELRKIFKELDNDDSVEAVILRINSPGGAVVASDELNLAIRDLSESKVTVAQLADTAASGGYYAAVAADHIIANRATLTGSIGVILQLPNFDELFDNIGVSITTIKSGEFKDIGAIDRPITENEEAIFQSIVDESYQQFIDAIVAGRDLDRDAVLDFADGRVFSGSQALELDMIDQLGTFDDAILTAAELADIEDPTVIEYGDDSFFSQLFAAIRDVSPTASIEKYVPSSEIGVYYLVSN